jgi:hypothetical protein
VNVETKEQSFIKQDKKIIQTLSARKLMEIVCWDKRGVLMMEFKQQGTVIMSEVYCETLKKLRRAMGMLTYGVVLLHDNARPHKVARTQARLEYFNWETFDHPPHGPNSLLVTTSVYLPEELARITVLQR